MSETLFSQSWYRVANLQPRLRSHVQIYKHRYRGEDWYVIQDQFTGKHHRFSPEAYQLIGLMDGRRTLDQIWQKVCGELGDHMPTQDETINLLSTLFRSDLLQTSIIPNLDEIDERFKKGKRSKLLMNLRSPMSVKFPLIDPDRFLTKTLPLVRPFLGVPALIAWFMTVVIALTLAILHWPDLTENLTDSLLALENVLLVTLLYPFLKVVHEFGHGYMVKRWGGEVHEMGVMFLVFIPIPYVDGSSSLVFQSKYQRMLVGAAGIMIELLLAALAFFVWLNVEPGIIRAIAFNTMLIAGVSTLLFNGNPLLRFDAYYVLSDFLEIPNLGQRANKYVGYLCQKYLLGVYQAESNARTTGEACWLFAYAVASFCYRIFLSIRIILFVAGKFFFIGILLALWAGYGMLIAPVIKIAKYLFRNATMRRKRTRVMSVVVLPILLLLAVIIFVPLPSATVCEGVTWVPEESHLYSSGDGFVSEVFIKSGEIVEKGQPLIKLENSEVTINQKQLQFRLEEYTALYEKTFQEDKAEAALIEEEIHRLEAEIARANERSESLLVKSPADGEFIIEKQNDLVGRFIGRGTLLGYVIDHDQMQIRVVIDQSGVELVRNRLKGVEVRLAEGINEIIPAKLIRSVPAATRNLPSMALSLEGGGKYALDPRSESKTEVITQLFQFDLKPLNKQISRIDQRVYVRFQLIPEPLAHRFYRSLRRVFLSHFSF